MGKSGRRLTVTLSGNQLKLSGELGEREVEGGGGSQVGHH